MTDPLYAVSPLDGRYANRTKALAPYASEAGLMRARVRVEIEYLISLAAVGAVELSLTEEQIRDLRLIYEDFDRTDAALIKQIETEGTDRYPATNHDVKAVEYFLRERMPEELDVDNWLHFALTSEDINNLAYRLLIRDAVAEIIRPALKAIESQLLTMAKSHRSLPMLALTHGQPATPTTFGKEMAVFVDRIRRGIERLDGAHARLGGKLAGATGTYSAHLTAYPGVDWQSFAQSFVESLGLEHLPIVTQVNPGDDLAELFDTLARINAVLLDLSLDCWLYISNEYLGQSATEGETGSSTMPHKVNPIDFENSEGNLKKANADLRFLADTIPQSRLQRDLSDSTVKRTIGGTLAHCLIGYSKLTDGLEKVVPNESVMRAELNEHPMVLAEAIQTVLRREGVDDAYEQLKNATRGEEVSLESLRTLIETLELPAETHDRLASMEPAGYCGLASQLVAELIDTDRADAS